jgi:hypothetical protein
MQTYHLNGTQLGDGTQMEITAPGVATSYDGSKTTYDFTALANYAEVVLTNSQLKALRATPKTLVAAPGAGKVIEFVSAILRNSGGANAITESADNMAVKYTDGSGAAVSDTIEATGFIDQTAETYTNAIQKKDNIVAGTGCENQALVLHNTGDGEYAGNAANDVILTVGIFYRVHNLN